MIGDNACDVLSPAVLRRFAYRSPSTDSAARMGYIPVGARLCTGLATHQSHLTLGATGPWHRQSPLLILDDERS
jgi:hypothetical protein